jgi:ATP-dependent DNA helicase RecQ
VIRALDYLAEQSLIELRSAGVRHRYKTLKVPDDVAALARTLHQRTVEREKRELERLHQVLELSEHDGCQVAMLCAHFAETLEHGCGHCTRCLDDAGPRPVPDRKPALIDASTWSKAQALRQQHAPVLKDDLVLARFLCGVTSPALTRAKLTSDDLFGALAHVPFRQVHDHITANR